MSDMSLTGVVLDLRASLHDLGKASGLFNAANDGDLKRHLQNALLRLVTKRPRLLSGSLTLVAGQQRYDADVPADLVSLSSVQWDDSGAPPWDCPTMPPPRITVVERSDQVKYFWAIPAPTATHIQHYGSSVQYRYKALHAVDEDAANTTVDPRDRGLLLLGAQLEAAKEQAFHTADRHIASTASRSRGRPGARNLYQSLLKDWEAYA